MIVTWYYLAMTALAVICSIIYFWKWHKHYDLFFSICFILIPLVDAGYVLLSVSKDVGEALTATKITYIGGCFLPPVVMMTIFSLCKIRLPRWLYFCALAFSTIVYGAMFSAGHTRLFYKSVSIAVYDSNTVLIKEYGPFHTVFYAMIFLYLALSVAALIYGFYFKNEASVKNIILLMITEALTIFSYFFGRMISAQIEWTPVGYLADLIIFLLIVDRMPLYDVGSTVIESLVERGENGFFSMDFKNNYLGANETAKNFLPDLRSAKVDRVITDGTMRDQVVLWIEDFKTDEITRDLFWERQGKIYKIRVNYLYDGKRRRGYQILVTDDTSHQQYLKSISDYNRNLKEEIDQKDRLIEKLRMDKTSTLP